MSGSTASISLPRCCENALQGCVDLMGRVRAEPRERPLVIRRILAARRMLREVVAAQQTLDLSYLHSNQAASGEWLNVMHPALSFC